jgi:hypothetical protein
VSVNDFASERNSPVPYYMKPHLWKRQFAACIGLERERSNQISIANNARFKTETNLR